MLTQTTTTDPFSASKKRTRATASEATEENVADVKDNVIVLDDNVVEKVEKTEDKPARETKTASTKTSTEIFKNIFAKGKENSAAVSHVPKWSGEDFKYEKEGKEWNLKMVTWNINGIRAWMEVNDRNI